MVIFSLMIVSGVLNSIRLLVTAPTAILLFALGGIVGGMVAEIFNPATLLQGSIYGLSLLIGIDSGFGIFYAIIRKKRNVFKLNHTIFILNLHFLFFEYILLMV